MNKSLFTAIRGFVAAGFLAGGLMTPLSSDAAWQLVDNFESYNTGNVQSPWVAHNGSGLIQIAAEGGNRFLAAGWANNHRTGSRPLPAAGQLGAGDGVATYFLQFKAGTSANWSSFGLAHNPATDDHFPAGSFLVETRVQSAGDGTLDLQVRDGENYHTVASLLPGLWYNLWLVVDRSSSDFFQVYLNTGGENATTADRLSYELEEMVVDAFSFRAGDYQNESISHVLVGAHSNPNQTMFVDNIWLDSAGENLGFTGVDMDGWRFDYAEFTGDIDLNFGTGSGMVDQSDLLRRLPGEFTLQSDALRLQPGSSSFTTTTAFAAIEDYVSRQDFTVESTLTLRRYNQVGDYRMGLAVLGGPHDPVSAPFDSLTDSGFYGLMWVPLDNGMESHLVIREGYHGPDLATTVWEGRKPDGTPGGLNQPYEIKAEGVYDETGALTLTFTVTDSNSFTQSITAEILNPIEGNLFGIGGRLRDIPAGARPQVDYSGLKVTLGDEPGPLVEDPAVLAPFTRNLGSASGRHDGSSFARNMPDDWSLQPQAHRLATTESAYHNSFATTRVFNFESGRDFFLGTEFALNDIASNAGDTRVALVLFGDKDRQVFDPANDSTFYTAQWEMANAQGGSLVIRQGMTSGTEVARVDFSDLPNPPTATSGLMYRLDAYAFHNDQGGVGITVSLNDSAGGRAVVSGSLATLPEGNRFGFGVRHRATENSVWDLRSIRWLNDPLFLDFRPVESGFTWQFGTEPGQLGLHDSLPLLISQRTQDWSLQDDALRIVPGASSLTNSAAVAWIGDYHERQDFYLSSEVTVQSRPTQDFNRIGFVVLGGPYNPASPFSVGSDAGYYSVTYFIRDNSLQIRNGLGGGTLVSSVPWTGDDQPGARYTFEASGEYDEAGDLTLTFTMTDSANHSQSITAVIENPVTGNLFGPGMRLQGGLDTVVDYHNFSLSLGEPPPPPADPGVTWPFRYSFGTGGSQDDLIDFATSNANHWTLEESSASITASSAEAGVAAATTRVTNVYHPGIDFVLRSEMTVGNLAGDAPRAGMILFADENIEVFDAADDSTYLSFTLEGDAALVVRHGLNGTEIARTDFSGLDNPPVIVSGQRYVLEFAGAYVDEGANLAFEGRIRDGNGGAASVAGTINGPFAERNRFGFGMAPMPKVKARPGISTPTVGDGTPFRRCTTRSRKPLRDMRLGYLTLGSARSRSFTC